MCALVSRFDEHNHRETLGIHTVDEKNTPTHINSKDKKRARFEHKIKNQQQ